MRPFALSARLMLNALVNSMPSCRHCPQSVHGCRHSFALVHGFRHSFALVHARGTHLLSFALVRARHHSFVLVHARRHSFSLICAHLCSPAPVCAHSYLPVVARAQIPALVPTGKTLTGAGTGFCRVRVRVWPLIPGGLPLQFPMCSNNAL